MGVAMREPTRSKPSDSWRTERLVRSTVPPNCRSWEPACVSRPL